MTARLTVCQSHPKSAATSATERPCRPTCSHAQRAARSVMPRLPITIRSSVCIHDPTAQTSLGQRQRTWRHTVTTGRPKLGRSTSRRRIVCLIRAGMPQLEQVGRGVVEAMWTCIGVLQPITPTTSMSASPTRARHSNVGSTSTGIPRVGGFRHPHPRGVPVRVRASSAATHPSYRAPPTSEAPDFVVMVHGTRADADALWDEVADVLAPMGLRLSAEKTRVVHLDEGFDFLGWRIQRRRIRGHNGKQAVYTYPSKKSLASVTGKVRSLTRRHKHRTLADLLHAVNRVLRGWCNYFRHGVSSQTFSYVDHFTWWRIVGCGTCQAW
jgi:hypothetical protein